jgi:DNA primase
LTIARTNPLLSIKDRSLVEGYVRVVSGWVGVEPNDIRAAMHGANTIVTVEVDATPVGNHSFASFEKSPVQKAERDVLVALLQHPEVIGMGLGADVLACAFTHPALAAIRDAMVTAFAKFGEPDWLSSVESAATETLRPLISELAMVDIPVYRVQRQKPFNESVAAAAARIAKEEADTRKNLETYVVNVAKSQVETDLARQREELHSMLTRLGDDAPERAGVQRRISDLELRRRQLRTEE